MFLPRSRALTPRFGKIVPPLIIDLPPESGSISQASSIQQQLSVIREESGQHTISGKNKLKERNISESSIKDGMLEINDNDYYKTLVGLFEKKIKLINESNPFKKKSKIYQYLKQKGFESNLIWDLLNNTKF